MAIFYMDVKIIGRSSGRSSVGAAAYRAGEKLQSVAHASYQSGEKLQGKVGKNGKITHDYRKKKGVIHSEIILPENAPEEYKDRQTLWNTVEASETRKNSQLAREIIVALPREFTLQEQLEVVRKYVTENFVGKGMIADFAIHDTGDDNPHSHIMLTLRDVTPKGFGGKNRNWNKKENLMEWRKAWTHIINNTFEQKGLDERIDHRTLKEQGIDRKSSIHLGHVATALERRGIKTERGDYNREIRRRNDERTALLKEAEPMEQQEAIIMRELQQPPKAEETPQIIQKMQTPRGIFPETQRIALYMSELENTHFMLDKETDRLDTQHNEYYQKIAKLDYDAENIDEDAKNIKTLQNMETALRIERRNLHLWEGKRKKEVDKELKQIEADLKAAHYNFRMKYHMEPDRAFVEIKRIQKEKGLAEMKLGEIKSRMADIARDIDAIESEYRTQKLLADTRPDKDQIYELLEQMREMPTDIRDRIQYKRIDHQLNTITDDVFKKLVGKMYQHQDERNRNLTKPKNRIR